MTKHYRPDYGVIAVAADSEIETLPQLLDQIKKFVCEYENAKDLIIKFNQEELWLQGPGGPNDIRVICSYPSKARV